MQSLVREDVVQYAHARHPCVLLCLSRPHSDMSEAADGAQRVQELSARAAMDCNCRRFWGRKHVPLSECFTVCHGMITKPLSMLALAASFGSGQDPSWAQTAAEEAEKAVILCVYIHISLNICICCMQCLSLMA